MTAIGNLNRRLILQAPVETADGAGGFSRSFAAVATLWAQVVPVSARAAITADGLGAALRYTIVIRVRDDITTRHQLIDGTHVYRVIAVRPDADRRFLEIEAEERAD